MLKPTARRRVARINRDQRSVAALEFALILPLIVLLFFGVYDLCEGMITYGEVFNAAQSIAASASNLAVNGSSQINNTTFSAGSTQLTYTQIQTEESALWGQIPTLRAYFQDGTKSVTISSIDFEKAVPACVASTLTCVYNAYVVWSVTYTGGPSGRSFQDTAAAYRNCAAETVVFNGTSYVATLKASSAQNEVGATGGSPSDLGTLRTANVASPDPIVAPPDPILVVDVHVQYVPVFPIFLKAPIDFWANGYFPVRSVQASQVNANNTATSLSSDQQYTGIVSTSTVAGGVSTYTPVNGPAANTSYCISPYYPEPTS